jgi:hypothetical protein
MKVKDLYAAWNAGHRVVIIFDDRGPTTFKTRKDYQAWLRYNNHDGQLKPHIVFALRDMFGARFTTNSHG